MSNRQDIPLKLQRFASEPYYRPFEERVEAKFKILLENQIKIATAIEALCNLNIDGEF